MRDFAVVGSGVGGSSIAAYLDARGHDTVLFEKEPYLGGCSSTFVHKGHHYNTGATTLAGYEDGHVVKTLLDSIGCRPALIPTDPAIVILHNGRYVPRYQELERFIAVVEQAYPHPKNEAFWSLVYDIVKRFYATDGYTYSNRSTFSKLGSLCTYLPLAIRFHHYLRVDASTFIRDFFEDISDAYLDFMEAQLMIVAQASSSEVNFLTAALALGYTFNATHYVPGGMGTLFDQITAQMHDVRRATTIEKVVRVGGHYQLHTRDETIEARNIILNTTVYDTPALFEDRDVKRFYGRYGHLDNHQSSFMLYMTIKSDARFEHHYQIIEEQVFPHTLSKALFVSFSDVDDDEIVPKGHYSITASIHTDSRWWEDRQVYKEQKKRVADLLKATICARLDISESQIVHVDSATPRTFGRYIRRTQLGGNAITMKNLFPRLPGNDTPFRGLYHVGDTVYAAQGWPGVMMGVKNLTKLLHV